MTKFLLIEHQVAMGTWAPADVRRHFDHQRRLDAELAAAGELVEAQRLGGRAQRVAGGDPAGEIALPALAGYRIVDVETEERALEIAARVSAAPGPGGLPLGRQIDVRPLLSP
jgi:hypothetical protein